MGRSKTSGIITDEQGNKIVNKVYQGRRIFRRLGAVSQEEAEQWLARQTEERRKAREYGTRPERNFADAAEKYLIERAHKASIDADALHITALLPFIGMRPLREIHDGTLEPFKAQRRRDGVSETTIKRALEVVRCILNLAARSWRDEHGTTWLETAPLITMPDTRRTARKPYPLSWDEQRRLFALLPATIAHMALFAVNTGCREQEVCQLRWAWEVPVPELETSVFVIRPNSGVAPGARVSRTARTVSWCSTMWRSEWSKPNEDCIGCSCSSPAKANRASQSATSTTRPGRK